MLFLRGVKISTSPIKPSAWLRSCNSAFTKRFTAGVVQQNSDNNKSTDGNGSEEFSDEVDSSTDYKGLKTEQLLEKASRNIVDQLEFPSDAEEYDSQFKSYGAWKKNQERHAYRPKVDPRDTSILLFPGQGSQFVGMGNELLDYPNVIEMYSRASKILGYDLLDLCLNGPKEKLDKTLHCQPAVLVTSLAALEKLRHEKPVVIENCISASGFSVGEISALCFSGVFSFEDAVKLVKIRAQAMQKASEMAPSGMMTVRLSAKHKIKFACLAARQYCQERLNMENPTCEIANYLFPGCKVIAGNEEALAFIENMPSEFGIKRCRRLPVSGAFHSKLMEPAQRKLQEHLSNMEMQKPYIYVHSNLTAYKYKDKRVIKEHLVKQLTSPVKWEQIMHILYTRRPGIEFPMTYEVGPGKQLGILLKMVNSKAYGNYHKVEV